MAMAKKQKFLLFLIIIACGYIAWQVYDLMNPALPEEAVSKVQKAVPRGAVVKAPTSTPVSMPPVRQVPAAASVPTPAAAEATPIAKIVPEDSDSSRDQVQYVHLLNQYQLLKMKHMLLEEEVAIATARQKIATLGAETGGVASEDEFGNGDSGVTMSMDDSGYSVVYIDYQNGRWNATINNKGRFEEVTIGSKLSDGARVVDIDNKSVVVKSDNQLLRLTFGGSAPVTSQTDPAQKVSAPVNTPAPVSSSSGALPVNSQSAKVIAETTVAAPSSFPLTNNQPGKAKVIAEAAVEEVGANNSEVAKPSTAPTSALPAPAASAKVAKALSLDKKEMQVYSQITNKSAPASVDVAKPVVAAGSDFYTLQLVSSATINSIDTFVKDNPLGPDAFYLQKKQNGKNHYILAFGKYRTPAEAKAAIKSLPKGARALSPFVRAVKSDEQIVSMR